MFEDLYRDIERRRNSLANEEEVRQSWIGALSRHLGIDFHAERGKRDSSYNNVVIEFKDRGLFQGKEGSSAFREAIYERLEPYILRTSRQEGLDPGNYIGIAIDGEHVSFAQIVDGKIQHGPLLPFSPTSVSLVAAACKGASRRAVTAANLVEDFGITSPIAARLMQVLADALAEAMTGPNNKIKMLFEEWRALFGQVADLTTEQLRKLNRSLRFQVAVAHDDQVSASLFVIHTYNCLIIKLLAAEVVAAHGLTSYQNFSQLTATLPDDELIGRVDADLEHAGLFRQAGINGFVEEAIFSWYIDAAKDPRHRGTIAPAPRDVLVQLSIYRTDQLDQARSNDVLKAFYQNLIPETLRKSLGEFYTPDWLVEFTVDKVNPNDWLEARVLDPTCGSGSFLLEVIRRKRQQAKSAGLDDAELLRVLANSVWGFDLNPLAVQTARVNFLMAVSDLLSSTTGTEFEVPVLLADAIYSPARDPRAGEEIVEYTIGSSVAALTIRLPAELAFDRSRLDGVFDTMADAVEQNMDWSAAAASLVRRGNLTQEETQEWGPPLSSTYTRVLRLHEQNWNGIWFRIVRNFFWSATAGRFDLVVGNPPWVRWSKLPLLYRDRVKPTCLQYDIFSATPHHGGNELDISAIITYSVADKWLSENGLLAFVITQTHFQSPSSAGFRKFHLNEHDSLIPLSVDDFKALKPFSDAANKTAVALFRKSNQQVPLYPVDYRV